MKNLEQLQIGAKSQQFTEKSHVWANIGRSEEFALQFAKVIHKLCPSLRYIGIGHHPAWHIQYCNGKDETGLEFVPPTEPLTEEDMDEIKFFKYDNFAEQSALVGLDHYKYRERDPEEDARVERLLLSRPELLGRKPLIKSDDWKVDFPELFQG